MSLLSHVFALEEGCLKGNWIFQVDKSVSRKNRPSLSISHQLKHSLFVRQVTEEPQWNSPPLHDSPRQ